MGKPIVLSPNWIRGFKTDTARDQLPKDVAWRMKDLIPEPSRGGVRGRGGWTYGSPSLVTSGSSKMEHVLWAPFYTSSGRSIPFLVAVNDHGDVFLVDPDALTAGTSVRVTAGIVPSNKHPLFFHKGFVIAPYGDVDKITASGTTAVKAALQPSSPIAAYVGASWGEYVILANNQADHINRMWFSAAGVPGDFTLTTAFLDMPDEIVAIVPLKNVMLVYGYKDTWSLTGDTPPPGGNFFRRTFANGNGLAAAKAVVTYKENAIWCNPNGIYKSDGSLPIDVTERAGIKSWWLEQMRGFGISVGNPAPNPWLNTNDWDISCGIFRGKLFVTIKKPLTFTTQSWTTVSIDLEDYTCFEYKNVFAAHYAQRSGSPGVTGKGTGLPRAGDEELFFARGDVERVGALASTFREYDNVDVAATNKDADTTTVLPELETAFYDLGTPAMKRLKRAFLGYELTIGSGGSPTLDVQYTLDPSVVIPGGGTSLAIAYSNFQRTVLKGAIPIRDRAHKIAFRILQTGSSTRTRLYGLEIEGHSLEGSRKP